MHRVLSWVVVQLYLACAVCGPVAWPLRCVGTPVCDSAAVVQWLVMRLAVHALSRVLGVWYHVRCGFPLWTVR
jgi:hypothetical protein